MKLSAAVIGSGESAADNHIPAYQRIPALKAPGKTHSDMQRGFIRAEVIAYEELRQVGDMKAAREKGLFRLEGKEYVIKDGDIVKFRFSV